MASGRLLIPSWMPALDGDGAPIPNARVYFYVNKTTTLASIFADEDLTIPLVNPVPANASGRYPAVWADEDALYSWSVDAPYGPAGIPFTGDDLSVSVSAEVLVLEAIESATGEATGAAASAAASAEQAQQAYEDIVDFAANGPEAASIANKLNLNGSNLPDSQALALRTAIGGPAVIDPRADFGVAFDGTNADAGMALAIQSALLTKRKIVLPPGTIVLTQSLNAIVASFGGDFGANIDIEGSGIQKTIIDWRGTGPFIEVETSTAYKFALGGSIGGFTLTQTVPVANSDGIVIRSNVNMKMYDIEIDNLTGTGFDTQCLSGDADGNVLVHWENIRVTRCKKWGWKGAAATGHNENSGLTTRSVFVQNCGTPEYTAITGITQANPAVVTSANHGRVNGDLVYIGGAQGMSQVNTSNSEMAYVVAGATTNTFQLQGVNSTGYSAYTSGGHVISARPESGGVDWKGQVTRHDQMFLTINENVSLFIENGPATAQGCDLSGVVIENPKMVGGIIAGISVFKSTQGQSYANAAQAGVPCYLGWVLDGTTDVVQQVEFDQHTVRVTADNPDYSQWNIVGPNVAVQTCRVNGNTLWKEFGYSRQRRFSSRWQFDAIQDDTELVVLNSTSAVIRPKLQSSGNKIPVRARFATGGNVSTGEWIARSVSSIAVAPVGGAATTYNVYTSDDSNTDIAELSTTGFVTDSHGYRVKSDDPTKLFKGRVRTDGAGGFQTDNIGWLNPTPIAGRTGPAWGWVSSADRKWYVRDTLAMPSSVDDASYAYLMALEGFITNTVVTIPAGAGGVFTASVAVAGIAVGDYIWDVQTTAGLGGFAAVATCNVAGTVQVKFFDPAQVGGSLNSGNPVRIQFLYNRR